VHYLVAEKSGCVQRAARSIAAQQDGHWTDYRALRQVGEHVHLSHSNKDYLGVLRLIAPDAASLDARFAAAIADLHWELA
jgi:hypothetical protein